MTAPSLWTALDVKGDAATKESSTNLFATLAHRAKLENERPKHIDHANVEKLLEKEPLKKLIGVTEKRSLLNVTYFVLHNPQTNEYFRIAEKEKFLWDRMDGDHSIRDLALEYFNQYGMFAYDKIIELVFDLKQKTFLTETYVNIYQKLSLWRKGKFLAAKAFAGIRRSLSWDIPVANTDRVFSFLYQNLYRVFWTKTGKTLMAVVAIGGFVSFLLLSVTNPGMLRAGKDSLPAIAVVLYLSNLIGLFFHEIGHGVATKHYRRDVRTAGFLLYFGWPAFYVDTTDMWMEEKEKRIAVSLAGIISDVVIAGVASSIALAIPNHTAVSPMLYTFAFVSYGSVLINLNPLLEWDGYFVFMDLVGIPCLRKRSLHFIRHQLLQKIRKRETLSRKEIFYAIFGVFVAVWSVVATITAVNLWQQQLRHLLDLKARP